MRSGSATGTCGGSRRATTTGGRKRSSPPGSSVPTPSTFPWIRAPSWRSTKGRRERPRKRRSRRRRRGPSGWSGSRSGEAARPPTFSRPGVVLLVGVVLAFVSMRGTGRPAPPPPVGGPADRRRQRRGRRGQRRPRKPADDTAVPAADNAVASGGQRGAAAAADDGARRRSAAAAAPAPTVSAVGGAGPLTGPFQLFLEASEHTWVMYSFDDGDPIDVTLFMGDKISIQAEQAHHPQDRERRRRRRDAERATAPSLRGKRPGPEHHVRSMSRGGAAGERTFHASPAFLVRAADMGEADRRLTFFTRTAGVVSIVGKSAWKSRKRFGGLLQRYVLLDIVWTETPGKIPVLSTASVSASFWTIVEEWERVRHADYLLELAAEMFPQEGPKPKAFDILLDGIRVARGGRGSREGGPPGGGGIPRDRGMGPGPVGLPEMRADGQPVVPVPPVRGGGVVRILRNGERDETVPGGGQNVEGAPGRRRDDEGAAPGSGWNCRGITRGYTRVCRVLPGEAAPQPRRGVKAESRSKTFNIYNDFLTIPPAGCKYA